MKGQARGVMAMAVLLLSGCASIYSTPPTVVHQPMTVRPEARTQMAPANGSIYQAAQLRPLFEDRRARLVGDTLTINLVERNTAQKRANSSATRDSDVTGGITAASKVPLSGLAGMDLQAGVKSDFEGKGASAANNVFNGTITVTVIEVYPNGNLLVSGEKQMAINQGNEFIRFSGVINPITVTAANTVQSTQVADARIEYKGSGYIDESNTMGWLQRFFVAVSPF
ncbi:flagellar basal body L-ring protein FlgH [Aromatoleum toluclasticum]|uniref:flagellar basal body L-ring protein FlgH n=1 Tax=Aromatoleum toluclasticum TaxID=92003 RepID=UPI001D19410A|nr:flagellar basal body L-ring protein FlgH [Aromatoleum toluclasticum]MCC4115925.1 flagellar basal body L-ring protein FlgH [Aromatoleum toluclasticum]